MSSSSSSGSETDSDEDTVSSLEIEDFKDDSGRWSDEVSSSEDSSSSDEDSTDVTSEESSFNNKKGKVTLESESSASSDSFESDSSESSEESKPKLKSAMKKTAAIVSDSEDSSDESERKVKSAMKKPALKKPAIKSNSSDDSDRHVKSAAKKPATKSALKKTVIESSDSDDSSNESEPKTKSAMKKTPAKSEKKQSSADKSSPNGSHSKSRSSDLKKPAVKQATKKIIVNESDSESSDESEPKSTIKKSSSKQSRKDSNELAPPGISEDAYKRFFSKPVELSPEKESTRIVSNEPSLAHSQLMIKHVEDEVKKRRDELNSSQHSLKSCENIIHGMNKDLLGSMDDIDDTVIGDISIEDESKNYKDFPKRPRSEMAVLRDKREMRLAKVRERIRAKEQAKERESDTKKMKEFESKINGGAGLDMSENARRERAYGWYTRMAMPSKDDMKQRVAGMPASSGVRVEDVDLLPWSVSGRMVNVAKMQKYINEGFKKKIAPRPRRPIKPDSDSESS
ncbi:hypothetical protein FisN_19Hh092 [Fistulifera solaris]|uniref:Uncharacterized protein n=1 Tax=Fistulifera solaris TaxID=1519565 RepID=A0A1Z5JZU5_FISSO|nr:hypothetical protein FisN_19Hh092 [Fistulifera solaris]|eukprot:GAX19517.1 hypothetical protein FisN_19Hh092 [Fistulifera solaris]